MKYAKIIVKSNYEKRGDLVLRSYVRALNKIQENRLLDGDTAFIYGRVDDNGTFYEYFTGEIIDFNECVYAEDKEIFDLAMMTPERKALLTKIMQRVLFRKDRVFLDFEVSTIEDLARDRYIEMDAYENHLSGIMPYPRLSADDDQSYSIAFDVLAHKINAIKKIRRMDKEPGIDEYNPANYELLARTRGQYVKR